MNLVHTTPIIAELFDAPVLKDSALHGKGVFACRNYEINEEIVCERTEKSHSCSVDKRVGAGIAPTKYIGRLNHSCKSNCMYVWKEASSSKAIVAIRPIVSGEEIKVDYCEGITEPSIEAYEKAWRLNYLNTKFSFTCTCEFCSDDSAEDKIRRAQIIDIISKKIPECIAAQNPILALEYCEKTIELLKLCELDVPSNLKPVYSDMSQIYKHGVKDQAKAAEYAALLG